MRLKEVTESNFFFLDRLNTGSVMMGYFWLVLKMSPNSLILYQEQSSLLSGGKSKAQSSFWWDDGGGDGWVDGGGRAQVMSCLLSGHKLALSSHEALIADLRVGLASLLTLFWTCSENLGYTVIPQLSFPSFYSSFCYVRVFSFLF